MKRLTTRTSMDGKAKLIVADGTLSDKLIEQIAIQRLAEYEDAEEQGLLVRLPCKVGDTVYSKDGKVAEVEEFFVEKRAVAAQVCFECNYDCENCAFNSWHTEYSGEHSCDGEYGNAIISVADFGKTVFLTREEARKALEEV